VTLGRLTCWALRGHEWLRVNVTERWDGVVVREFTNYRCSRCGRTAPAPPRSRDLTQR
jgi:hypothetical protein